MLWAPPAVRAAWAAAWAVSSSAGAASGQRDQGEGQGPGGEQGTDSFHVQFLLFAWFQENHTPSTKWKVKHLL